LPERQTQRLDWERDGVDWPHREASRFVRAGGLRWHVQQMGQGPALLLIHGTGASTHSWRGLMPLLAAHFSVVAMDLPGHGFSDAAAASGMSLPGMAGAISALLAEIGVEPALVVGHSAGAAIAAQMILDERIAPRALVAVNGALLALHGLAGLVFAPAARLMALSPLVPRLFSWRARDAAALERLIGGTGSRLDAQGVALYARLVRNPGHVAGALAMMANWDLGAFECALSRLQVPLVLVVGENDRTLPPRQAQRVVQRVAGARALRLPGLGHLAHEEAPQQLAQIVMQVAREQALLPTH